MAVLTSPQNRYLRLARSLARVKDRRRTGLYRLEGLKLVNDALAAGAPLQFVLYAPAVAAKDDGRDLLEKLAARRIPCYPVAEKLWPDLSTTVTPQGILAVVERREPRLEDILGRFGQGLFLVLDGVQDPGNAGTLLRTAAAAGCDGVIALTGTTDLYGDKALRAAAGAQFCVPLVTGVEPEEFLAAVKSGGKALVLAVPTGGEHYAAFNWLRPLTLVVANEGRGPRPQIAAAAQEKVTVPMRWGESLNVAVAAAVLLFEAARRRELGG